MWNFFLNICYRKTWGVLGVDLAETCESVLKISAILFFGLPILFDEVFIGVTEPKLDLANDP